MGIDLDLRFLLGSNNLSDNWQYQLQPNRTNQVDMASNLQQTWRSNKAHKYPQDMDFGLRIRFQAGRSNCSGIDSLFRSRGLLKWILRGRSTLSGMAGNVQGHEAPDGPKKFRQDMGTVWPMTCQVGSSSLVDMGMLCSLSCQSQGNSILEDKAIGMLEPAFQKSLSSSRLEQE
jgi:hypothetical protein